jgi:hypothetical protein
MCHLLFRSEFVFDDFGVTLFAEGKAMPATGAMSKIFKKIGIYLKSTYAPQPSF